MPPRMARTGASSCLVALLISMLVSLPLSTTILPPRNLPLSLPLRLRGGGAAAATGGASRGIPGGPTAGINPRPEMDVLEFMAERYVKAAHESMGPQLVEQMLALPPPGQASPNVEKLREQLRILLIGGQEAYERGEGGDEVWGEDGGLTMDMLKGLAEADTGIRDPPHNWEADSTFCMEVLRSGRELSREEYWRVGIGMVTALQREVDEMETGTEWWRATEPIVLKPQNNIRGLQIAPEDLYDRPEAQNLTADDLELGASPCPIVRSCVAETIEEKSPFLSPEETAHVQHIIQQGSGLTMPPGGGPMEAIFPVPGKPFPRYNGQIPKMEALFDTAFRIVESRAESGPAFDGRDHWTDLEPEERGFRVQFGVGWPPEGEDPLFPSPPEPCSISLMPPPSDDRWLDEDQDHGVIWYLGSRHDPVHPIYQELDEADRPPPRPKWINPAKSGRVKVLCGAGGADGGGLSFQTAPPMSREDVLERGIVGEYFFFKDGWFAVDLGEGTRLKVQGYAVRQGGTGLSMVTWVLEGAQDLDEGTQGGGWATIDERTRTDVILNAVEGPREGLEESQQGDGAAQELSQKWLQSMKDPHATVYFSCGGPQGGGRRNDGGGGGNDGEGEGYRYLRLRQLENSCDPDDPMHEPSWMWVQGFEVYGNLTVA